MSSLDVDRSVLHSPSSRKRTSFPSSSLGLSHGHIRDALARSPDDGATLVLLKLNLTYVGEAAAEELATIGRNSPDDESRVERIALGQNRLTALPTEFALLSRLRYLNLKHNSFTVFPNVLTLMPSLDTLDISHNKIKRLPTQPGNLVNLRVFCFSRNKVTRLPTYLPKFHNLAVLEVERNPIEWPPKHIVERNGLPTTAEAMKNWIRGVQKWIEHESTRGLRGHDDSGFSEMDNRIDDSFNTWSRPEGDYDDGVTPHARSFSIDSTFSMSSVEDSTPLYTPASYGQSDRPPPLHIGILQSYSTDNSPTHESYLPSPAESDTFFDPDSTGDLNHKEASPMNHGRNASYTASLHHYNRVEYLGKKSMPDLRTAKLNFTKKTPDRGIPSTTHHSSRSHYQDDFSMPSPMSTRQDSDGSSFKHGPQFSPTRAVPSMAFERNSYFRRLSTIPLATISTLPTPLLDLVDTARSILFAVCQIYQTLEHYTLHSIDERLSSVLKKVLYPASADMIQFINSLDRFDAMSRKMIPPPPVCRGVVESCRDTVAVFGKTVGVLALQLKVIVNVDDLRYLRSLLVQLYGAAAEISLAWQSMIPQIESIKPYLHSRPAPSPPSAMGFVSPEPHSNSSSHSFLSEAPLSRTGASVRNHNSRRHAGSFSSKDVELGKALPDEVDLSHSTTSRGTLRATSKRQNNLTPATLTVQSPSPTSPGVPSSIPSSSSAISLAESSRVNHSRSGSLSSLQASSASSSPSIPTKTSFLELPSTSRNQVDKEALHAVQAAVDVAPTVWDQMEEVLASALEHNSEVRESLERARSVTKRLSDMIRAMKESDSSADKRSLREDANVFLKTVVQLSTYVKTYGGVRSSTLRTNMVKLTNSTEEFAILLHVSSFSPSSSGSRPYSPMPSASSSQLSLLNPPEEARLGPGLSRSRSAQPSTGIPKIPVSPAHEGSRSALPSQSFKLPIIKRFRDKEPRLDVSDPG
ncbi:hypothetical protein K435DRAFT_642682 [Dendrothele bispora CBS 962.96]|uniref:L domain-like protein n=1 Tax=Dendrothele bispora (strain CBS 962.96) TaxID=1314807 RepID=A0A4S8MX46_DENBC|nr:hypothetical protein K435DRAFT_642682 [Dendrothele bispora CBS 962.96]